jgi:hypothetical protein
MENQDIENRLAQIETSLNEMTAALYDALNDLAGVVRSGSNDEMAAKIEALARIPCEHWPNCFAENMESDTEKGY